MEIVDAEWVEPVNIIATDEARKLASRFQMLSIDDIHNEMWVWILKHQEKVETTLAEDPRALAFYLRTEGRRYSITEKARIEGYSVQDLHFYSAKQLTDILPSVFDTRDWQPSGITGEQGMPRGQSDPRTGGNLMAFLSDVSQGLASLREADYNLIVWRYKYDWSDEQLGEQLECSPEAAKKRVQRAVKSLQTQLGGATPFADTTGGRHVISNAAARARTSAVYEGDS